MRPTWTTQKLYLKTRKERKKGEREGWGEEKKNGFKDGRKVLGKD